MEGTGTDAATGPGWHRTSNDIDEQAQMLPDWEQAYVQLECGRFESVIDGVRMDEGLGLFRKRTNRRLHKVFATPAGTCAVALLAPGSDAILFQHRRALAGDLLVLPPAQEFDIVTQGTFDVVVATLAIDQLPSGFEADIDPGGTVVSTCAATHRLASVTQRIFGEANVDRSPRHRLLNQQLACDVVGCLGLGGPATIARSKGRDDVALLDAARRLLLAEAQADGQALPVPELAERLGVSVRQLQKLFRGRLGMPPRAYAERVRLARARAELRESAPGETTVAAVATRWGFGHLGRFSSLYRVVFGELPSDTART